MWKSRRKPFWRFCVWMIKDSVHEKHERHEKKAMPLIIVGVIRQFSLVSWIFAGRKVCFGYFVLFVDGRFL